PLSPSVHFHPRPDPFKADLLPSISRKRRPSIAYVTSPGEPMIPILTLAEIKDVERKTIGEYGLTEFEMIQSAGEAVFETIKTMLIRNEFQDNPHDDLDDDGGPPEPIPPTPRRDENIAFVCGPGHNGADGLAAALLASQAGYAVVVYQVPSERGFSPE